MNLGKFKVFGSKEGKGLQRNKEILIFKENFINFEKIKKSIEKIREFKKQ